MVIALFFHEIQEHQLSRPVQRMRQAQGANFFAGRSLERQKGSAGPAVHAPSSPISGPILLLEDEGIGKGTRLGCCMYTRRH